MDQPTTEQITHPGATAVAPPDENPPVIVLLGPTAVGKTALSLRLCETFQGEVVSADSRQIYRGMDICTAKATPAERQRVPHHLIDICDPDTSFSLAEYQRHAYTTIDAIHARGHVPFLVGGTALYIRAVVEGLRLPEVPPNPALRVELEEFLAHHGRDALLQWLQEVDPTTAAVIDGKNPRRVLRALEIFLSTGQSKVALEGSTPPPYRILQIGLDRPREELYARTDARIDAMVEAGLVAETQGLLAAGYYPPLPAITSLGYREIIDFLEGRLSWEAAIEKFKTETHRYVRHQYTWFRKMQGIHWFDLATASSTANQVEVHNAIHRLVADFLNQSS
ncbi:MAG TPA: tRNA (adenosine(37)-N6)-dimethylallyltransferase MiaA [Caldilineaceae bacterium]|nr:tRNA (adenosine(37)-N6)-dimethylallyltransferase MiaA [Caldilineaceae bacterium]